MFNLIPNEIEDMILSYLINNKNINTILKYIHYIQYKKSLNFINKKKLSDFIFSKFTHFYLTSSRLIIYKSQRIRARYFGFEVSYNGDIVPGNGRFYGYGITFCLGTENQIFNLKVTKYNQNISKKQRSKTFIIKQIINSD